MLTFHWTGRVRRDRVECRWTASSFALSPEVRELIDREWAQATATPGIHLFDGPMCRLESFEAGPQRLAMAFSPTSYRAFLGTNMRHPELADRLGPAALASPTGLSCALVSRDGVLLLGRRNQRVAYYPGRIHPFAGSLEPAPAIDVFADAQRELSEELGLEASDVESIELAALVEDASLRQPELVFIVRSTRTAARIESGMDRGEHCATVHVAGAVEAERLLAGGELTPVGRGALLIWGQERFGQAWSVSQGGKEWPSPGGVPRPIR